MSETGPIILVIDDERPVRRFLRASLTGHGYFVHEAENGQEGIQAVAALHPDLVVLDLGLPDMDGCEVTRQLREWTQVPIIILSVRNREEDKIAALDAGADDFLTKPFGPGELLARMRAALRRVLPPNSEPIFSANDLEVDFPHRIVKLKGQEISLTPTEYDLLRLLTQNAGKVLTHHQILREVWGTAYEGESHLLRVNISNLRRKIETDPTRPQLLLTEPGVGYRFK
ncbi:MAG TPA: response regulator, partial [Anaerolineaceae bacterium]|nr:response regulator [Anaerolineaceae bacterium]